MQKKLRNLLQDKSGAAELITVVVSIIFAVSIGVLIVTFLKDATSQTYTGMMHHLKDMGNSGY